MCTINKGLGWQARDPQGGVQMVDRGLSSLPMECEFPQGATSGQLYGLGAKLLLYDIDLILYKY